MFGLLLSILINKSKGPKPKTIKTKTLYKWDLCRLYGEYMESYLWTEEEVEGKFSKSDFQVPGFFVYDVASVISVWGWQLTYTALVPFIMLVEIFSAVKTSIVR